MKIECFVGTASFRCLQASRLHLNYILQFVDLNLKVMVDLIILIVAVAIEAAVVALVAVFVVVVHLAETFDLENVQLFVLVWLFA